MVHNLATGTLRYTEDLVNGLAASGNACKVLCLGGQKPSGAGSSFELVEMLPPLPFMQDSPWGWTLLQFVRPLVLTIRLRRTLVRERPHVLFSQNMDESSMMCCVASWGLRTRLVLFVHDLTEREILVYRHSLPSVALPAIYAVTKMRQRFISLFNPHLIAASDYIRRNIQGYSKYPTAVISHGVRSIFLRPPRTGSTDGLRILCVGKLQFKKRWDVVIRAIALLKDLNLKLTIVGSGPLRSDLESLVETLGVSDRVRFTGYLDDPALAEEFARADAAVLPSLWEGFGYAAIEAMNAGVPVIASDSGSLPEVVKKGVNGYLFPPGDHAELARLLRSLYVNRTSLDGLRKAASATAAKYPVGKMVRSTEAFLVSLM